MVFGKLKGVDIDLPKPDPEHQPDALYHQQPDGSFEQVAEAWGVADTARNRGLALGDINRDGFLDLVTIPLYEEAAIHLSRCDGSAWLMVDLDQPGMNRRAVGATVLVDDGEQQQVRWVHAGGTSLASAGPLTAHFGLGDAEAVSLTVIWPDGEQSTFSGVTTRQRVEVTRLSK